MNAFVLVTLGGALGAGMRYALSIWAKSALGSAAYLGTGAINIVGSFAMGAAFAYLVAKSEVSPFAPLILTGILGGFTTFSAFSLEMMQLLQAGKTGEALFYATTSVILGILAVYFGYMLVMK